MVEQEEKTENKELVVSQDLGKGVDFYFNADSFELAQRIGKMFATSSLVPAAFQGNTQNCVIALNLAKRMEIDAFMLMQNMYVVHGKPGLEAKLVIAMINRCGRFSPLKYQEEGSGDTRSCYAFATELKSGEVLKGPVITWAMVKKEGWDKPKGTQTSKWMTMPELMFRYRAAAYFGRTYCPEVTMGMHTRDELDDIELVKGSDGAYRAPITLADALGGKVQIEPESETRNDNAASNEQNIDLDQGETQAPESDLADLEKDYYVDSVYVATLAEYDKYKTPDMPEVIELARQVRKGTRKIENLDLEDLKELVKLMREEIIEHGENKELR